MRARSPRLIVAKRVDARACDLADEVTAVVKRVAPFARRARPHLRELMRPDTYGSSLRSKVRSTALSLIVQFPTRTRFHPSGAPVAAGAVLLCQSHGCFYFPRWRSLPARIIPQPTHRPPPAHCLRSAACRRRSPRSPRQVLLQRASLGRAPMETRCAALLLRCNRPRPPPTVDPWLVRTRAFSRGARSVTPRAQRAARLHTLVLSRLAAPRSGVRVGRAAPERAPTAAS